MISFDRLTKLLGRRSDDPGFADALRLAIGEFDSSEDEGDRYFTGRLTGVEVLTRADGTVDAVFLFGPNSDEGSEYRGELPFQLRFSDTRGKVRAVLGPPLESSDGETFVGRVVLPWDKFRRGDYVLHVRYTPDFQRIDRVTLAPLDASASR